MKRSYKTILTLSLLFCSHCPLNAQQTDIFDLQQFIETRFNNQKSNLNYEELYERLLLLYENPIDLNLASEDDFMNLSILSQSQISALIEYRHSYGKLITPFELRYIEGFDSETISSMLPFVTIKGINKDNRPLLQRLMTERNNYFILRYERTLEMREGYTPPEDSLDSRYLGSPDKLYLRYRVSKTGDFSFGFTTEKDAGEYLTWDPKKKTYGLDFWSGHAMLENQGKFRKAIIGDYQLQLGQGLVFGSGFGIGKGSETVNSLERISTGISPYTSVMEAGFLRGAATTYDISKQLIGTFFISRLNQGASIQEGDEGSFQNYFSTVNLAGLHRTELETSRRRNITESIYGVNLQFKTNSNKRLGLIAGASQFNLPILRSDQAYNRFEFTGKRNYNISLYGNTKWQRFRFFGETAISKSGGTGSILGMTTSLSKRVDFGLLLRSYDRDFHSIKGASFTEGSRPINESGIYWGLKYKLNRLFNLTAYYDSFRFPWLRFRVNTPSTGNDFLLRLNYAPQKQTSLYLQFRGKRRSENAVDPDTNLKQVLLGQSRRLILNLQYHVSTTMRIQSRVQYSDFEINDQITTGYAMMQDFDYKSSNLSISTRMALFDTEGVQNRQYAYERDVLYAFSIPAYSGQGIRNYILLSYSIDRKVDLWLRLARTTFYDRQEIGTGLERISGNSRTDLKFQIRYKIK